MSIKVEEYRKEIDLNYVGFRPNTTSVKPVHLANGFFRTLAGQVSDTKSLVKFAITQKHDGTVPKGHELESVFAHLQEIGAIDPEITEGQLGRLRSMIRRVLSADGALYPGGMDSYSAFGLPFLSRDRIGQDAGEFVADWLSQSSPDLASFLTDSISDPSDPITLLCRPVVPQITESYVRAGTVRLTELIANFPADVSELWEGMHKASQTLSEHLKQHPSKLVRARLVTLFSGLVIVRYLASIEAGRIGDDLLPPPILLSMNVGDRSIAEASRLSYQRVGQSLARFYAWAFGEMCRKHYSVKELTELDPPDYKKHEAQAKEIWATAIDEAEDSDEAFDVFGRALYEILAMEAEANPVTYFRALCVRLGLAYPVSNNQPFKQFHPSDDLTELLVMCSVGPDEEPLSLDELQERMWQRFGVIIGGSVVDEERLEKGGIFRVDTDALRLNREAFSSALVELGLATAMADGVIEVHFSGRTV